MFRIPRSLVITYTSILLILSGLLLWPGLLQNLFKTIGFEPHGASFRWIPNLLALFTVSDLVIGMAHLAIAFSLIYLVYRARRSIPYHWIFLTFGGFIVTCALTHLLDVVTLWNPLYWLSGYMRLITAFASVTAAVLLPPLIPRTLDMIRAAKESQEHKANLVLVNNELERLYTRQVELAQLKGELFASVSYELRTPLTLLLGPVESLQSASNLTAEQRTLLKVVERNARALQQHLDDLLDLSRIQTGKSVLRYAEVDLAGLMRLTANYFEVMTRQGKIDFVLETPDKLMAQVDQDKFKQIVLNLLANAFRYVPDGGKVCCSLTQLQDKAIIQIQDNGPDIRPGSGHSIFERLIQSNEHDTIRSEGGSSLGLAIATEYIALHGGEIGFERVPTGGVTYHVTLPLSAPENVVVRDKRSTGERPSESGVPPLLDGLRPYKAETKPLGSEDTRPLVVVVEDNIDMNRFVTTALGMKYRVMSAYNGQEGLNLALNQHPDLIISDLMMPFMSGDELVHALRTRPGLSRIPIVLLTARVDNEMRVRLLREGAQDYLVKPFSVDELLVRVDNLIAQKRAHDLLEQEIVHQEEDAAVLIAELDRRKKELDQTLHDLQLSESRFRRLAEANIIGIMLVNLNGMIMEANDAFLNMIGYSREEIAAGLVRWTDITPDGYSEQDRQLVEEIRRTGVATPWEKEYIHKSGRHVPVLIGVAMLEGSHDDCVCFVVDLTERKRAEDMQRFLAQASSVLASSLNYEDVLEKLVNVSVPIFADWCTLYTRDNEGNLRLSNVACQDDRLTSILNDTANRRLAGLGQLDDVNSVFQTGKASWISSFDIGSFDEAQYPDKAVLIDILRRIDLRSRIVLPLTTRGETIGVITFNTAGRFAHNYTQDDVAIAEDLARRAALAVDNARLYTESQQAIRARDEFLSIAAHELRTPVTSLRGFSQLTLRQFQRDEHPDLMRVRRSLESIEFQSTRLTRLVNQLLSIARIQSGRLTLEYGPVNVSEIVRSVATSAQSMTNKHQITVNVPQDLIVSGDAMRLEQVLTNIVDNAIKYSPKGGPVSIELTIPGDAMARLAITDKGIGIPPEHQGNIFNRYYQAHGKNYLGGMGLGLYISREIVELHGGTIRVEAPEDGGTRFVVELPLETGTAQSPDSQPLVANGD